MDRQLLIAESLLDWIEIKICELRTESLSDREKEKKCKAVISFIRGYRSKDETLSKLLLNEEWLKVREEAFTHKVKVH